MTDCGCEKAKAELEEYLHNELCSEDAADIREHVDHCEDCRSELRVGVAITEVELPGGATAGFTVSVVAGVDVDVDIEVASTGGGATSFANSRYATSTYASFAFFAISFSRASSVR